MYYNKFMTISVLILSLGIFVVDVKGSTIVEFSEVSLTSPTLLDGTTYFEPFGLSFEDTTYWGIDSRTIGAGIDDVGIGPTDEPDTIMTVVFLEGADWVKVDWLIITNHTLTATAFDEFGNILDTQSEIGIDDINHGIFIFSDTGIIDKITFGDNYTAVGRLEFVPIPEPLTLSLYAIGVLFLGRRRNVKLV